MAPSGNCTTFNGSIYGSSQNPSTKEWQQALSQDYRRRVVEKNVTRILNIIQQDNHSLSPEHLATIKNNVQKKEDNAYNTATSHEDYLQRLAEPINKIRNDYEKQILTTTLSSIDKSAGEQGPPNRVAPQSEYSTSFSTTQIKTEEISSNHEPNIQTMAIVKEEEKMTTETSINGRSITTTTVEMIKTEKLGLESHKSNRPQIDATSKSLPKYPAVFSSEDIRDKMTQILRHLYNQKDGSWFREPVTNAIAPGYFDIIKKPMDFSTIFKKFDENQYTTPYQFCKDMWLVFNNTWTYNGTADPVYKAGVKLAGKFMKLVDPIMKDYGYCCGGQYVFLPPQMSCYGVGGNYCKIPRDGDYFVYNNPDSSRNNLSGDKYTFCKKCFDSVKSDYMLVGDDLAQALAELPKAEFLQAKNDHQEPEAMVDCIVCSRRFHNICVLYHEHIWPEGYVCKLCVQQYNIKRKDNGYLSHKLAMNDLANTLEERVNNFFQKECDPDLGRVTIRVLAASDRICEVKPRFKEHFGPIVPDGYPYRTKAIFAFQEIEGVDVVLFGMYVQEYDSQCPAPNTKRVYISYLDSVHYFQPKQKRTALYYEILIGYLEYVKQLGFVYAHIWVCPPNEGDDYIFHCHPVEQRVPKLKRLQNWYKTMLDIAVQQRVVVDFKDIMKYCTDSDINKVTDIPYFEGDFWTSIIEDLIEKLEAVKVSDDGCFDDSVEPEEPTEQNSNKRKLRGDTTDKKKNFKKTTGQRRIARKNMTNGSDLFSKVYEVMKKHKESFFVVRLQNPMSNPATLTDTDPLIQCALMESRDAFLNFARDKHCEFSSLRRAKYSTMVLLAELHSSTADEISYTCTTTIKHEHRTERSDETTANSDTPINIEQQTQLIRQQMVEAIRHAVECLNANCIIRTCRSCKRLIQHTEECTEARKHRCPLCNKFLPSIWFHAKTCSDRNCRLPYCTSFKHKLQRQRAATMQAD